MFRRLKENTIWAKYQVLIFSICRYVVQISYGGDGVSETAGGITFLHTESAFAVERVSLDADRSEVSIRRVNITLKI